MSKKTRRRFSSASHAIQKASLKLATFKLSPLFIAIIVMMISVFLLGGGIYDILMEPLAILPIGSGRFLSYIPYRIHEQLLVGSIGVMILYAMGAVGLLMIYYSTKYVRNLRQVSFLSKIGVLLLLLAFVAVEVVIFWILNYQVTSS